jgi:hypothetical protein
MTQVTDEAISKAWRNWRNVTHGNYSQYSQFIIFLEAGSKPVWTASSSADWLNPEVLRRVEMLCGPHHRAIIKAYYAKQQIT